MSRSSLRERTDIVLAVLVVALIGVSVGVLVYQATLRDEIVRNRAVLCADMRARGRPTPPSCPDREP